MGISWVYQIYVISIASNRDQPEKHATYAGPGSLSSSSSQKQGPGGDLNDHLLKDS
jgi:hypothetical protein